MPELLPTSDDVRWEDRVADLELNMLERLRDHADRWRGGLIALTGLVATATAVTAPFLGTRLTDDAKTTVGISALVAVLALGLGAGAAMRAAYGQPTSIDNTGTALREWTGAEVRKSACWLKTAQAGTLIGFAALVFAAAVGFTQAANPATYVVGTPKTGPEVCGTLVLAADKVQITAPDGTAYSFILADLAKITAAANC